MHVWFLCKRDLRIFVAEIVKKTTRFHQFFKWKSYDILLGVALKEFKRISLEWIGKGVTDNWIVLELRMKFKCLNLNYGVNFRIHLIPCNKTITFFLRVLNNKKKIIESKPPEQTSHVILKREFALLHTGRTFNR